MKWTFVCALALIGCGGSSGIVDLRASDKQLEFQVAGQPDSEPREITFVNVGDSETEPLFAKITGSTQFRMASDECGGRRLRGGQSCKIAIVMRGDTSGLASGQLEVSAAPLTVIVQLVGRASDPSLALTVKTPMVEVPAGQSATIEATVQNVGGGRTDTVMLFANPGFHVIGDCVRPLGAGERCEFVVRMDEVSLNERAGLLIGGVLTATAKNVPAVYADVTVKVTEARSLTAIDYNWGEWPVGSAPNQIFAIRNPGPMAVSGAKVEILPDVGSEGIFAVGSETCSKPNTVPDKICVVNVTPTTKAPGSYAATLVVTDAHFHPARARLTVSAK